MRAVLVAVFAALVVSASASASVQPQEQSSTLSNAAPVREYVTSKTTTKGSIAALAQSAGGSSMSFDRMTLSTTTTTTATTTTTTTTTTNPPAEIPGLGSSYQSSVEKLSTDEAVEAMSYKEDGVPKQVRRALDMARTQVGVPYEADAMKPGVGFDCSGIIRWAYGQAGVELPHNSAYQLSVTKKVSRKDLRPGDLVFTGNPISHVALYMGNKIVLQAPATGGQVQYVRVDSWNKMVKFGRVIEE